MGLNVTHTYVVLDVSETTYKEIAEKLRAAGYDHVFGEDEGREEIDMHGIGLAVTRERVACVNEGLETAIVKSGAGTCTQCKQPVKVVDWKMRHYA